MIQNQSFFTHFFEDLVEEAAVIDLNGQIVLSKSEHWKGQSWRDLIPVGVHESFEYAYKWCLEIHKPRSVQAPLVVGSQIKWIQYRLAYYHEESFSGVSLIALDISHQVETLDELEKLSRSIEQTPTMIVMTDINGKIEYVNPSYEKLYGVSLSEIIDTRPAQLIEKSDEDQALMWRSLTMGDSWSGEIQVIRPEGQAGVERVKAFCIQNELGEITQFCFIAEDITRENHLQDQLIQSQRLEAIGTLAGGVAHDFNNILMIISGFAEIGQRHLEPEHRSLKAFQTILEATERASKMTNSLLSFSRRQDISLESFDINQYIQELVPLWKRLIPSMIEIEFEPIESEAFILADKVHLEQILMNLVVNARDGITEAQRTSGLIRLYLELDDSMISIMVKDNGAGIPQEVQKRIFEPFYTTKEKGKGTGLGLSTVIGLVEQHHGQLTLKSTLGEGTEFKIVLPMSSQLEEASQSIEGEGHSEGSTVLMVDDEKHIRLFYREVLEEMGYQVMEASDGLEAQQLIHEHSFDVIITDLNMPRCHGHELLQKIQGMEVHVVVISGFPSEFDALDSKVTQSFSSFQCLNKPTPVQKLLKLMKTIS